MSELYNERRAELATEEFVYAEIGAVRVEISEVRSEISELRAEINTICTDLKLNALLLKILIAIAVFGLTLFNPSFIKLIELAVK